MILVYKCLLLWCVFYNHVLERFINAVKIGRIIWCIQFLEWSDNFFVHVFIMILFCLISFFCVRKGIDIFMYVFFPPVILLSINVLFNFYVFSIEQSIDRIHFRISPIVGLSFILKDITRRLGILFYFYVLNLCFIQSHHVKD